MGLCNAFPDLERAADLLVPIQGNPPDLHDMPPGCRFAPRCPFAIGPCTRETPPLTETDVGHKVACWRAAEAPALRPLATEAATWTR
jgi:peptide/nickel transport system ATP-binding protein